MKTKTFFTAAVLVVAAALLFSSCSLIFPPDQDLVGVWSGIVDGDLDDTFYVDFNSDGTANFGGDVFSSDGAAASYKWSTEGEHLEVSALLGLYKTLYVYDYNSAYDTLTLYMIAGSVMNDYYDDYELQAGVRIDLIKSDSSFNELILNDSYSSSSYY